MDRIIDDPNFDVRKKKYRECVINACKLALMSSSSVDKPSKV